jgi:Mrp family chromosome partitioning ATPase
MASMMNIPILGLVENMSYMKCPCCDEKIHVFQSDHIDEFLLDQKVDLLAELPIKGEMAHINTIDDDTRAIFKEMSQKIILMIQK